MATEEDYTRGSDNERRRQEGTRRREPQQGRRPQSAASGQKTRRTRPASSDSAGQQTSRMAKRPQTQGRSAQTRPAQGTSRTASASGTRRPATSEARRPSSRQSQGGQRTQRTAQRPRTRQEASHTRRQGAAAPRTAPTSRGAGAARTRPQSAARRNPSRSAERPRQQKQQKQLPVIPLVLGAVAVIAIGIGIYLFFNPLSFKVTINGQEQTISRGTTISKVIEDGIVSPKAGNLLAVDDSLIEKGGGDLFSATVNGTPTNDGDTVIERDAEVVISDGANVTEDYDQTEEVIAHGEGTVDTDMGSYFNYALHVFSDGEDGLETTKTGKVSGITVTEETKPVVDSGYYIYTPDVGDDKVIALTFDDGPWPDTTEQILDLLEQYDAKATFFTIGNQISSYSDSVKRAYDMGCEVCTHTWDHAEGSGQGVNITFMTEEEQIEEVEKGFDAIEKVIGTEPERILRAPGGNFYGDAIENLRPYLKAEIGWDVDTKDWSRPGSDSIYEAIMTVKPGQVILMHDGGGDRSQTVEALAKALPELQAEGFQFVTISDLLAYGLPSSRSKLSSIPTTTDSSTSSSKTSSSDSDSDSDYDAESDTGDDYDTTDA